jgi:hypothetical protein
VHVIAALNTQIAELETVLVDHFETHPDADIYRSLPGLGVVLGPSSCPRPFSAATVWVSAWVSTPPVTSCSIGTKPVDNRVKRPGTSASSSRIRQPANHHCG